MLAFEKILAGGDLRSIGNSNSIVLQVQHQSDFDELFKYLFHQNRIVVMRTADAIEKITITQPEYIKTHQNEIIELCKIAKNKELVWHLALLIPRLQLKGSEFNNAWDILTKWAKDKKNSKIVRVNSIQGLYEMMLQKRKLEQNFNMVLLKLEEDNIPSINARIKKIRNHINC